MRLSEAVVRAVARHALAEDAAFQDVTTLSFIPEGVRVRGRIVAREDGVLCGMRLSQEVFKIFDPRVSFQPLKKDGAAVRRGETLAVVSGRGRSVLSCERVALNFISYLSGIATQTSLAVRAVRKARIRILDTRKTTPLLRIFEKYAVLCGGGRNHRYDLAGQYLVKDNHLFILRKIRGFDRMAVRAEDIPFEIEVDDLSELKKALSLGPDIVMLDNFSPAQVRQAIVLMRRIFPDADARPLLELSGGINLKNIRRYAIKGVDFISLGALTHSAPALDISLEITRVCGR